MLGSEVKTMFEGLVEDSMDETLTYQLMNRAKGQVETSQDWEILKKLDSSKTALVSDTWNSPGKALPTDFFLPRKLYVGTDRVPYDLIQFEGAQNFQSVSRKWYIDLRQALFFLTGSVSGSQTLYLYYIYGTTDFTAANAGTTTWPFPDRFHPLLAFKMAELWFAKDMTELGRSWDRKWLKEYRDLWNDALLWDSRLKVMTQQGGASHRDTAKEPSVFTV